MVKMPFCVAGVALCHITTYSNMFHHVSQIVLAFQKMSCIFGGRRSTLDILRAFANRIARAMSSGDNVPTAVFGTLYNFQFTLCTPHSTLDTSHFALATHHSTRCTPHSSTLRTLNFTLRTPYSILDSQTLHLTPHTLPFTLPTLHFALYT